MHAASLITVKVVAVVVLGEWLEYFQQYRAMPSLSRFASLLVAELRAKPLSPVIANRMTAFQRMTKTAGTSEIRRKTAISDLPDL
jgi:hypothetical protein